MVEFFYVCARFSFPVLGLTSLMLGITSLVLGFSFPVLGLTSLMLGITSLVLGIINLYARILILY